MKGVVRPQADVRNRIGWKERLSRLRGGAVQYDLQRYDTELAAMTRMEHELRVLSDQRLQDRASAVGHAVRAGQTRAQVRASFFALVREASRRALGQRPFDVQMVAALALDDGRVVEMQTGEGKTLTAVMPAALGALSGQGVHVLTFNDYLAHRDAGWMQPIYRMLGLSVACVQQPLPAADRRAAYLADVTYVTAKEAGFDHLRDCLAAESGALVHRPFHYAVVDEADSLMIDEARVPLVVAGSIGGFESNAPRLAALVASLRPGVHFDTDEYARDVELTEAGIEHVEQALGCGRLHRDPNYTLLTQLHCALHARVLLRKDVDYIIRDGRIAIVDEFTGRVVQDRHWPDGLQAALEAKEGITRGTDGQILGSMTLQRFLRGYTRLCGMTATARECASELQHLYGLEVAVIPTHLPMIRNDRPDVVFTHREVRDRAVVDEVRRASAAGRPVLVGTPTVEESERLAALLLASGVNCQVLNARNDAAEAQIVAEAGAPGAVTISTNMAGRGTDIRLGGRAGNDREHVTSLGGLYVIGTSRHESRRVDLQLRGRAGRQGDPGESRFFVSLEDDLLVRYGIDCLIPERFRPARREEPIGDPVVRREIARAQRIVEGQNLEIRRTLDRYASVLEEQHRRVMDRRRGILLGVDDGQVWRAAPEQRELLVSAAGERAVREAERAVALFHIDRAWRDHLAQCADVREGIHLVRLGGQDPLTFYTSEVIQAFSRMEEAVGVSVLEALNALRIRNGVPDLEAIGIKAPASTWTYLVNDDPFRNRIGSMLTGPGGTTVAIYAAVMMPLHLIAWGLVERFFGRRPNTPR